MIFAGVLLPGVLGAATAGTIFLAGVFLQGILGAAIGPGDFDGIFGDFFIRAAKESFPQNLSHCSWGHSTHC